MQQSLLKTIIAEQQEIRPLDTRINRVLPIETKRLVETENILIITGIRRCGKSTLLQHLRQQHHEKHYYLNFDDERLIEFTIHDFQLMMEIFIELFGKEKTCYFDEIQNIEGWERFVRRLYDQGYKIFITGSNANMLSQELGTHLTGRHITLELYPFSFHEFSAYKQLEVHTKIITTEKKVELKKHIESYLQIGGFPQFIKEEMIDYLQSLYENILYKDIIVRYKLPSEHAIKQLAFHFASNIGKEITYNSLRKMLGLGSTNTLSDYCEYFENCYLFFLVRRFNYSLKTQIASPKKVYAIDTGMARAIGFRSTRDRGRMLENLVFIELKRRKYEIYYHRETKECDFVACKQNHIEHLIQVCYDLSEKETKTREIDGLLDAMETYQITEGLIITLSESAKHQVEHKHCVYTINVVPIWEWLSV
ncbi:MAG: ATP-binding protein [marine bacterium B5-7]|nr:MAG: ATP-binding protein [marine bacterium B5-7]